MALIRPLRQMRFLRRFRRGTRSAAAFGNKVSFYAHGATLFEALFLAIDQAQESICLEFYIVRADTFGQKLAARILAAAARGVRVYLLYDYMGSFDTPRSFFRTLEQGGVICTPFNPPSFKRGFTWLDKRDHRKIAVIDGFLAFTGGINIGDEYAGYGESPQHWRDVGISISGPAASILQTLFREAWLGETGSEPAGCGTRLAKPFASGDDEVYVVSGGPHHNRSFIRNTFRMAIAGAVEEIVIANPYFIPGPRITRSLLRAARRGVSVKVVLPAVSDVPLVRLVSRSSYTPLLQAGIQIFEREKTTLHAKIMLVDGSWTVIGSANLDQRSFHRNFEVNCIITSHEFGGQVAVMLAEELAQSRQVHLHDHERRGWLVRVLERALSVISWFL